LPGRSSRKIPWSQIIALIPECFFVNCFGANLLLLEEVFMPTVRDYQEIRKAFTQLLTIDSVVEDKEEMEFLIDAFAKHVSLHSTEEELKEKLQSSETLLQFFKEYLDQLAYQLDIKKTRK
jgi:hypothetical protein